MEKRKAVYGLWRIKFERIENSAAMKQKQSDQFVHYPFRLANEDDLPRIVKYMQAPSRPILVFNRTEEAFANAVNNGLMWLLTDEQDNILMTSAVYIIPVIANLGSTYGNGLPEYASLAINFAEVGSVWREKSAPAGFCLDLAYSACILQAYSKANNLSISTLVTQAVADDEKGIKNQRGIDKLLGLEQGWGYYLPNNEFITQFQKTIPDQSSRDIKLASFCTPVNAALLGAARCLLGRNNNPKFSVIPKGTDALKAFDQKTKKFVIIDLNETGLLPLAKELSQKNGANLKKCLTKNMSWHSAHNALQSAKDSSYTKVPKASKKASSHGYSKSSAAVELRAV